MPVFENLRNFIRHGKQAGVYDEKVPLAVTSSIASDVSMEGGQNPPINVNGAATGTGAAGGSGSEPTTYDAVKQMVAEEEALKGHIPKYETLNRFKLMEKLGDGAFSIVYRAIDTKTNQQVAVKVVSKNDLSSSQKSSILKEVAIMRQLQHPNVVDLLDFSESAQHYFIVLELVTGGELFHRIVKLTYFSEDLSRHVIVQVAEAVRYLHEEAGVVHRDIKPENLLFYPIDIVPSRPQTLRKGDDSESKVDEGQFQPGIGGGGIGTIKLADFGLSKVIWDSKTMTPCGTVGYTAPEIVRDEKYSKSVDMWALGCVLYTILCGFPPFYDESIEVLTEKVAKGQYTFLSPWWDDISADAKDLVAKLLTVDPDKRYTIEDFMNHRWIRAGAVADPATKAKAAAINAGAHLPPAKNLMSPATVTLKEVFDVSNAVHRREQEKVKAGRRAIPRDIIEEDEEEEGGNYTATSAASMDGVQRRFENVSVRRNGPASSTGGFFDLRLEGATLLARRKKMNPIFT